MNNLFETKIKEYFHRLGLNTEEIKIYLSLVSNGPSTILEISKQTKIPRTAVYRLIENLVEKGVVELIMDSKRKIYQAANIYKVELLIQEQELKTKYLKENFGDIVNLMSGNVAASQPGTKVLFYKGEDGLKQQFWNTLSAKAEILGYTPADFYPFQESEFGEKWRVEMLLKKIQMREIVSEDYLNNITAEQINNLSKKFPTTQFKARVIKGRPFKVSHVIDIFNDVVSFGSWKEGDLYGVEIYNERLADWQRQLFEISWDLATGTEF